MQFYLSCLWLDYCEMSESKVCNDSLHILIYDNIRANQTHPYTGQGRAAVHLKATIYLFKEETRELLPILLHWNLWQV